MSKGGYPQYPPAYPSDAPPTLPYPGAPLPYGGPAPLTQDPSAPPNPYSQYPAAPSNQYPTNPAGAPSQYPGAPPNYYQQPQYPPQPGSMDPPPVYTLNDPQPPYPGFQQVGPPPTAPLYEPPNTAPPQYGQQQFGASAPVPPQYGGGFPPQKQQGTIIHPQGAPTTGQLYPQLPPPVPPPPKGYNYSAGADINNQNVPPIAVPQRPAPPPPSSSSGVGFAAASGLVQSYSGQLGAVNPTGGYQDSQYKAQQQPWKDTPLPEFVRESWQCGAGTKVYMIQYDGLLVSPSCDTFLKVYTNPEFDISRCPSRRASLTPNISRNNSRNSSRSNSLHSSPSREFAPSHQFAGMELPTQQFSVLVECPGICRVKLSPARGHVFVSSARDLLAMVDQGTKPSRCVVIALPKDLDPVHLQRLLSLMEENASITTDNDGVITTVSSTIESVFNLSTKFSNDLMKDKAPGLHKTTHVLRKGTGSLVRLGGSLINKGASMVVETVAPTSKEEKMLQFDPLVNQLKAAVLAVREGLTNDSIIYVAGPRSL